MSTIDLSNADEKSAKLTLRLRADSGYSCVATYRVSANQWAAIIAIAEQSAPTAPSVNSGDAPSPLSQEYRT